MPADTPPVRADSVAPAIDPTELNARAEWFGRNPDAWSEIVLLEAGGDRTHATTVQQVIARAVPAQRPALEQRLLAVLQRPELTAAGREFACRMLALIGSGACVPTLVPLLGDATTEHWARFALDGIEDPAVDAAYRDALVRLRGRARAGLIGSIVRRGDRAAVAALRAIATDAGEDARVRETAGRAVENLEARA